MVPGMQWKREGGLLEIDSCQNWEMPWLGLGNSDESYKTDAILSSIFYSSFFNFSPPSL